MTAECQRQLAVINLRFHDLQREAFAISEGGSANYVKFLDRKAEHHEPLPE